MSDQREEIMQTLSNEGAVCGECSTEPGDFKDCPDCTKVMGWYADALIGKGYAIEAQVREQVAREIEAERDREWIWVDVMASSPHKNLTVAARIARGPKL